MPTFGKRKGKGTGKLITAKGFEKLVKKELEANGSLMIRGDYRNGMPDYVQIQEFEHAVGIECKRYLSCTTVKQAMAKWRRQQPAQVKSFNKVRKHMQIALFFMLKDGKRAVRYLRIKS